jgi:hypothetical protein
MLAYNFDITISLCQKKLSAIALSNLLLVFIIGEDRVDGLVLNIVERG